MTPSDIEILDDNTEFNIQSNRWLIKLTIVTIVSSIYMFLMEYFRAELPDHLFYVGTIEIRFSSIGFLFILLLNSYFIPSFLEQGFPNWRLVSIAILSGVLFFGAILMKVFTYNYFVLNTGIRMNFGYIFFTSGLLGVLATFTANIRTRKLRGRNTYVAWILLFVVWYSLTAIATM